MRSKRYSNKPLFIAISWIVPRVYANQNSKKIEKETDGGDRNMIEITMRVTIAQLYRDHQVEKHEHEHEAQN